MCIRIYHWRNPLAVNIGEVVHATHVVRFYYNDQNIKVMEKVEANEDFVIVGSAIKCEGVYSHGFISRFEPENYEPASFKCTKRHVVYVGKQKLLGREFYLLPDHCSLKESND